MRSTLSFLYFDMLKNISERTEYTWLHIKRIVSGIFILIRHVNSLVGISLFWKKTDYFMHVHIASDEVNIDATVTICTILPCFEFHSFLTQNQLYWPTVCTYNTVWLWSYVASNVLYTQNRQQHSEVHKKMDKGAKAQSANGICTYIIYY